VIGRGVNRRLVYETVSDNGKERGGDQERRGECKHSNGVHAEFPRVMIVADAACNLLTVRWMRVSHACADNSGETRDSLRADTFGGDLGCRYRTHKTMAGLRLDVATATSETPGFAPRVI
jgi:hypothetical protein